LQCNFTNALFFKGIKIMKLSRIISSALAVMALTPAIAFAQFTPGAGLLGTPHDFASASGNLLNAGGQGQGGAGTVGLCTYCHTPHKALATQLLWNHTLSTNTFSWDVAATTAGTTFPSFAGGTYKGPTAKCLSCHDGSVAVGDIAWYKEASHQGAGNDLSGGQTMATIDANFVIGAGGAMKGNHPVGMPYPYGQAPNTYNGVTTGAGAVLTEWQSTPTASGVANIRLFNDNGSGTISAGAVASKTGIECSSCHDPHNKAAVDDWFLRGKVDGSTQADGYICLQCHIK
jgi:hypothetical protein